MSYFEVKDLNIYYKTNDGWFHAVKDMNFSIDKKDSVGIVGESGSGKSTFAMSVLQMHSKKSTKITGQILFNNQNLLECSPAEINKIRWDQISFVFQKSMSALSPTHKIGQQMKDIYMVHNKNKKASEIKQHCLNVLERVDLPSRVYEQYPHELSGGMMQRVSIALAVLNDPEIVFFDEATTALDVVVQNKVLEMIMDLEEDFNLTRFMITHDISTVASTCNKIIVMKDGKIIEMGDVNQVLLEPKEEYTKKLIDSYINIV